MAHIHDLIDWTVVAYIVYDNKVLLSKHQELQTWIPIGGHIELNEDPEQALMREIGEETGLKGNDIKIMAEKPDFNNEVTKSLYTPEFMDIHKINDTHKHIVIIYFARSSTDNVVVNKEEHDELSWFSASDLASDEVLLPSIRFYAEKALEKLSE